MKFYPRHLAALNNNITDRAFVLAIEIGTEREHILRRTLVVTAG
jgi:hypothetical protein